MELSDKHKQELADIYQTLRITKSLSTIDDLLTKATYIAVEYGEANNLLLVNLSQTRKKQYDEAAAEKDFREKFRLIEDLVNHFQADIIGYMKKNAWERNSNFQIRVSNWNAGYPV